MTDAEYKRKKRGIVVPFFFKRKIFMVIMMLLCSGIMAATATYADNLYYSGALGGYCKW